jgi:hypothetical protein
VTVRTVIDNTNRPATLADLETFGMRLGILCAQRIIRGYGEDPNDPDPSAIHVLLHFLQAVNYFVARERATNALTDAGEAAYRKGFDRGRESQMKNPEARIEIKRI